MDMGSPECKFSKNGVYRSGAMREGDKDEAFPHPFPIQKWYRTEEQEVCDRAHLENVRFSGYLRHSAFHTFSGVETLKVTGDYRVQSLLTIGASNVYNE
jgi:hypothetical protein